MLPAAAAASAAIFSAALPQELHPQRRAHSRSGSDRPGGRADRAGQFVCPHTGVALAVVEKLVNQQTIRPGARVVVISTANALKFTETKVAYHERRIPGVMSLRANQPIQQAADRDQLVETLTRVLRL